MQSRVDTEFDPYVGSSRIGACHLAGNPTTSARPIKSQPHYIPLGCMSMDIPEGYTRDHKS